MSSGRPPAAGHSAKALRYRGANWFRQRVVLATLSGRELHIKDIRAEDTVNPGLQNYEANLLRLIDRITDGAEFNIDVTGTELRYRPGSLVGGGDGLLSHDCGLERNISYFLEALILLAPFAKHPLQIKLRGLTNGSAALSTLYGGLQKMDHCSFANPHLDVSVDCLRITLLPFLRHIFGQSLADAISIKVIRRGLSPLGVGEVEFTCPILPHIQPFQLLTVGRVKRVRGIAFTNMVSQQFAARMIDQARGVLNDYLPDVWIYSAHARGPGEITKSDGYGMAIVAETMKGMFMGADITMDGIMQRQMKAFSMRGNTRTNANVPDGGGGALHVEDVEEHYTRTADIATLLRKQQQDRRDDDPDVSMVVGDTQGDNPDNESLDDDDDDDDLLDSSKQREEGVDGETLRSSRVLTECELAGRLTAQQLLLKIAHSGVIDVNYQYIPLLFMALAEEHQPCKLRIGRLTPYAVQFIRHLKDFFGVTFAFESVVDTNSALGSNNGTIEENDFPTNSHDKSKESTICQQNSFGLLTDENEEESADSDEESDSDNSEGGRKVLQSPLGLIVKCVGMGFRNLNRKTF